MNQIDLFEKEKSKRKKEEFFVMRATMLDNKPLFEVSIKIGVDGVPRSLNMELSQSALIVSGKISNKKIKQGEILRTLRGRGVRAIIQGVEVRVGDLRTSGGIILISGNWKQTIGEEMKIEMWGF